MKIILKKDIPSLGQIGQLVNVATGYAKNYLVPKGLALFATKENTLEIEKNLQELKEKNLNFIIEAKKIVDVLENQVFIFVSLASDMGVLYGAIKNKDILNKINNLIHSRIETNINIENTHLVISESLKNIGIYKIAVHLSSGVSCTIIINISRSELEAESALKSWFDKQEKQPSSN